LLLLAVAALLMSACRKPAGPAEELPRGDSNIVEMGVEAQRSAGLKIVEVAEQPLRLVLKATGVVSPDQSRVAHIFPLARGIVNRVQVQLGDRVGRAQPLLEYDNIELGQSIGEYLKLRGELERLEAQRAVARKSLDRAEALIEVEGISQHELDMRRSECEQAVAAVESQRADIARVEEQLHRFGLTDEEIPRLGGSDHGMHRTASHDTLRAPFSGVITKFNVSPGEVIDREKELFSVVDTSTVWALADIYEKDVGQVGIGMPCRMKVAAFPEEIFAGKITYLSDVLDPASRTAKLRCVVPNRDGRLKLEMFATVEIPLPATRSALGVPPGALQVVENQDVVFVERDAARFEKRVVEPGERSDDWVEIRQGLRAGERVVAEGGFYLKSVLLREQIGGEE
jgi:cobalt-zinc-cadmium efflux system membrane fusion protein